MRDGLSLLDQVLSFGEGPVTAERVREVLGLIPEDVYGEMLRLLVEQDARAVFALVDRLVEDGADLGQFAAGAADVLRAVLLVGLGGTPEDLSDGLVALVRRYAPRLPPADILRLLTVFGESEGQLRATGNARLAVEVLLLRWALMARTVDLADVMAALTGAGSPTPRPTPPPAPAAAAPPAPLPAAPAPAAPPVASERGSASVERLRALWPQVVADARARSQMLGTLLAQTEVASVDGGTVAVRLLGDNATYIDGLERQRDVLVQLLSRYVADPLRVIVAPKGAGPAAKPARLTPEAVRADRLAQLRASDPSLSAAVDALDLELLE